MKWASALSERAGLEAAVAEVTIAVQGQLGAQKPDLAMVFVSPHHEERWDSLPDVLAAALECSVVIGCSASGVVGGHRENEGDPALAVAVAHLPGVQLHPFHLDTREVPSTGMAPTFWKRRLPMPSDETPRFVLLPDPMTCHVQMLIGGLDRAFPGATVLGGLASGGQVAGRHVLYLDGASHRRGVVGVAMTGNVAVDALVAQGCRPIGLPMFVTQCDGNAILELDGRPVMELLEELYSELEPRDQQLFRSSLFLGLVMRENRQEYRQGDFLVRNLLGIDAQRSGLRVGALMHPNQVVQFHLRDAQTSAEDLALLLEQYRRGLPEGESPQGGLMFSCVGRGERLYGEPDHDLKMVQRHLGDVPLGGFFCNGELGPVQGTTFLHGYTNVLGFFRPLT
ncbi:MAG: FIST N-terminal domain-containing protein [Myxococcota bacterium]